MPVVASTQVVPSVGDAGGVAATVTPPPPASVAFAMSVK
jgi:hypothetical protein